VSTLAYRCRMDATNAIGALDNERLTVGGRHHLPWETQHMTTTNALVSIDTLDLPAEASI
jgi:hypothetical protein